MGVPGSPIATISGASASSEVLDAPICRGHGDVTSDPARFRIVSDPLPEKGRLRLFGCGISGRHPIVRLDRNASAANSAMDQLVRGDVARISRTTFAQDGLRIDGESPVTREP